MTKELHLWYLKGFVYLREDFIKTYECIAKKHGISKLARKLNVDYDTIAFYRRKKLVNISFLKEICEKLKINKKFAESSVTHFTQNLKQKYSLKFPINITPLHLRAVSMILGDGTGSLSECCTWTQNYPNISYGVDLIERINNFRPNYRSIEKSSNCKVMPIPNFLVEIVTKFLGLEGKVIKSVEYFDKVCKLSREWQFQVFAQLVVDEGSSDKTFMISQTTTEIKNGIVKLISRLGYKFTELKDRIYIHTESFPQIQNDLKIAKDSFGKFGGFWFKDDRFMLACKMVNSNLSKNSRLYNEEFMHTLDKVRQSKKIVSYNELKESITIPERALERRIKRALKKRIIVRISHGLYTFPEYINDDYIIRLSISKEERVLKVLSKYMHIRKDKLLKETRLSNGSLYRALKNLINDSRIQKSNFGYHKVS